MQPANSFGEILQRSVGLWRGHWKFFLGMAVLGWLPQVIQLVLPLTIPALSLAWGLATIVFGILLFGASIHYATIALDGEQPSAVEAVGSALGRGVSLLWTGFLFYLVLFAGILCFVIPGIIWFFNYVLSQVAVMVEGLSGQEALKRSKKLVWANRSLAANVVVGIPLLLMAAFVLLGALLAFLPSNVALPFHLGINLIAGWIGQICAISLVVLFHSLRSTLEYVPTEDSIGFSRY